MAKQKKSWFFLAPPTTAGQRFVKKNIPTQATYQELLDSIPFFEEKTDTATESVQGLVKLASDADVKGRTSQASGEMQTVVRPHQLPLIMLDTTEADTVDTPIVGGGLQATLKEVTDGSYKRYSTKIELEIDSLSVGVPDTAADYLVFYDDSGTAVKKVLIDDVLGASFWKRDTTGTPFLGPVTANDDLNMGYGDVYAGDIIFDITESGLTYRKIFVADNASDDGFGLIIHAGDSTSAGKDGGWLEIRAGEDTQALGNGGDIYVHGGIGTVVHGATILGYDRTLGKTGKVTVGTDTPVASYDLTVASGINVGAGGAVIKGLSSGTIENFVMIDANDVILEKTAIEIMEHILGGSATQGDIIWFNGTSWTALSDPGTDSYLSFNNSTNVVEWVAGSAADTFTVKVDATATPGYIGAGATEGVIQIENYGGLNKVDHTDYVGLSLDVDSLDVITADQSNREGYIAITDRVGDTKKIQISALIGDKNEGWLALSGGVDYTATPSSTSRIATADLTGSFEAGMPLKYKINGVADYRYAVISTIATTYIDICGDPLDSDIEELYIGSKNKIVQKTYHIDSATYNNTTTESLLQTKNNMMQGDRWTLGSAKVVRMEMIHLVDDTLKQPLVNVRCGAPASVTDYICTSNTNKGLRPSQSAWTSTVVDIDPTKNDITYGENIEIKVDNESSAGDDNAKYLTVTVTFVIK